MCRVSREEACVLEDGSDSGEVVDQEVESVSAFEGFENFFHHEAWSEEEVAEVFVDHLVNLFQGDGVWGDFRD